MKGKNKRLSFVSVIVPVRDEERFIKECLDSLLIQDYPSDQFEIIVIDDHSKDDTSKIVKKFSEEYPGKVIFIENDGVGGNMARRTGISHTRGNIIVNFSAHVIAERNFLTVLTSTLAKLGEKVGVVGCSFLPYENDNLLSKSIVTAMTSFFGGAGTSHQYLGKGRFVEGVAYATYRKKVINEIGGYPLVGGDSELNILVRSRGYKIYVTPETRVFYRYKRTKLRDFFKRMITYGIARTWNIKKYPDSFELMYIAPSVLFLLFLCTIFASFCFPHTLLAKVFMTAVSTYTILDILFSLYGSIRSRDPKMAPLLLVEYPLIHIGYGIGFICGLFKTPSQVCAN